MSYHALAASILHEVMDQTGAETELMINHFLYLEGGSPFRLAIFGERRNERESLDLQVFLEYVDKDASYRDASAEETSPEETDEDDEPSYGLTRRFFSES